MSSDRSSNGSSPRSWLEKLFSHFGNEPSTKTELVEITHEGIAKLTLEAQIQLWQNVSWLLIHKLTACLARESLD